MAVEHHWSDATKNRLAKVDQPCAVLLRHGYNQAIRRPGDIAKARLNQVEEDNARSLGSHLSGRIKGLYTSPYPFCRQTADAIAAGASIRQSVVEIDSIDVSAFVRDMPKAMAYWNAHGQGQVIQDLYSGKEVPGFHENPKHIAEEIVQTVAKSVTDRRGLVDIFVSNGAPLLWILALTFRSCVTDVYPEPLEGLIFFSRENELTAVYRGVEHRCSWPFPP